MTYGLLTFLFGLMATPIAIRRLRRSGVLDVPNARSSHDRPVVRGAGLGVASVAAVTLMLAGRTLNDPHLTVLAAVSASYGLLGLIDDLRDLPVIFRLCTQVLIAAIAITGMGAVTNWLLIPIAIVAVVGYLNAFNFMDGINGISALHASAVGLIWVVAGHRAGAQEAVVLGAVICGAALAFLPFNFPSARGFLGDAGSYFFGGAIGLGAVVLLTPLPMTVVALPMAPYAADTTWTLVRRVRRGESWREAHREHVYQRLLDTGLTHGASACIVALLTLATGAVGLLLQRADGDPVGTLLMFGLVATAVAAYLHLPTWLQARNQTPRQD